MGVDWRWREVWVGVDLLKIVSLFDLKCARIYNIAESK